MSSKKAKVQPKVAKIKPDDVVPTTRVISRHEIDIAVSRVTTQVLDDLATGHYAPLSLAQFHREIDAITGTGPEIGLKYAMASLRLLASELIEE